MELEKEKLGTEMAPHAEENSRPAERMKCRGEIDFWIGSSLPFSGYYADISTRGIYIETICPAPEGTRISMCFTLPGHDRTIETEGVVIWSDCPMGMGVRFLPLPQDAYTAIREFTLETQLQ